MPFIYETMCQFTKPFYQGILLNAINKLKCGGNYTEKCVSWEYYTHMKSPHGPECPFSKTPSYAMIFDCHSFIRNFAEPSQSLYWETAEKTHVGLWQAKLCFKYLMSHEPQGYHYQPYFCPPGRLEPALQRDTQSGPRLPSLAIYFCLLSSSPSSSIWFIFTNHTCSLKSTVNLHKFKTFLLKLYISQKRYVWEKPSGIFIIFLWRFNITKATFQVLKQHPGETHQNMFCSCSIKIQL